MDQADLSFSTYFHKLFIYWNYFLRQYSRSLRAPSYEFLDDICGYIVQNHILNQKKIHSKIRIQVNFNVWEPSVLGWDGVQT